jgi:hypothetical protein
MIEDDLTCAVIADLRKRTDENKTGADHVYVYEDEDDVAMNRIGPMWGRGNELLFVNELDRVDRVRWGEFSQTQKRALVFFEPTLKQFVGKIRLREQRERERVDGSRSTTTTTTTTTTNNNNNRNNESMIGFDYRHEAAKKFAEDGAVAFERLEREREREMVSFSNDGGNGNGRGTANVDDNNEFQTLQMLRVEFAEARKRSAIWTLLSLQFVENAGEDFPSSLMGCRENLSKWFRDFSEAFQPLDAEAPDFSSSLNNTNNKSRNNTHSSYYHERFQHLSVFEKRDAFFNESTTGGGLFLVGDDNNLEGPPARTEDCTSYWPCILAMLAVGWTEDCVNMLYAHSAWADWRLRSQAVRPQIEILEALIALIQKRPVLAFDRDDDDDENNNNAMNNNNEFENDEQNKEKKYGERLVAYTHSQYKAYRDVWKAQCYDLLQPQNDREVEENWAKCWGPTADGARRVLKILIGDEAELSMCTSNSLELFVATSLHKSPNATARNLRTQKKIWDDCLERKSTKRKNARFLTIEAIDFMSAVFDDDGLMSFSAVTRFTDSFFICLCALLLRNATTALNNATTTTSTKTATKYTTNSAMHIGNDDEDFDNDYEEDDVIVQENSSEDAFVEYFALEAVSSMLGSGIETRALSADYLSFLCPKRGRKIVETTLTNSLGMIGLRDAEAVYEFERLSAERGLNDFHRKNCNKVIAERLLEEEVTNDGGNKNDNLQTLFAILEHFDAAKDEISIERLCARLLRNTKFLTMNLPADDVFFLNNEKDKEDEEEEDKYAYPRGHSFITKVSDALRSTRGGRDRKEGSSASFIHARAKYVSCLRELKKFNKKSSSTTTTNNNRLELTFQAYEALLRQLNENCSPRYVWAELLCDAIPLFEGAYYAPRRRIKKGGENAPTAAAESLLLKRLKIITHEIFQKLEYANTQGSAFGTQITNAIDIETDARRDLQKFSESSLALARLAVLRAIAAF